MNREHSLLFVLSGIVLFTLISVVLLQLKTLRTVQEPPVPEPSPNLVSVPPKPLVRVLIMEDPSCTDCFDITKYAEELRGMINLTLERAPQDLFPVPRLPAIAFSSTVDEYPGNLTAGWETVGKIERLTSGQYNGTWYVLPTLNAPYVENGTVRGRVTATYITMDSCTDCYDVLLNREFMNASRIVPYKERFVDVSSPEGKELVATYKIRNVPTLIMSRDADAYPNVRPGWPVVGTIEQDGSYVLRNLQRLNVVYYDLNRSRVMRP